MLWIVCLLFQWMCRLIYKAGLIQKVLSLESTCLLVGWVDWRLIWAQQLIRMISLFLQTSATMKAWALLGSFFFLVPVVMGKSCQSRIHLSLHRQGMAQWPYSPQLAHSMDLHALNDRMISIYTILTYCIYDPREDWPLSGHILQVEYNPHTLRTPL